MMASKITRLIVDPELISTFSSHKGSALKKDRRCEHDKQIVFSKICNEKKNWWTTILNT